MTILNSNFEEWSAKNPEKDFTQFPFSVSKMGKSGALFDLDKLNDVSRDELSKLSPEDMYEFLNGWVNEFGTDADRAHFKDRDYVIKILALIMGAGQKKRRKDIERAGQGVRLFDYFFDDTFAPEYSFRFDNDTVNCMLATFAKDYDEHDDNSAWFAKLKTAAASAGFASENAEYKANPEKYKGNVSDAAEIVRIAITGSPNPPDT